MCHTTSYLTNVVSRKALRLRISDTAFQFRGIRKARADNTETLIGLHVHASAVINNALSATTAEPPGWEGATTKQNKLPVSVV